MEAHRPSFFILRLEHLINYFFTIVRLYFCPIICFVFLQISCFQIFVCFTHRGNFFLHQPEQLLFLILLHREYLFIFYSNIAFLINRVQLLFWIPTKIGCLGLVLYCQRELDFENPELNYILLTYQKQLKILSSASRYQIVMWPGVKCPQQAI